MPGDIVFLLERILVDVFSAKVIGIVLFNEGANLLTESKVFGRKIEVHASSPGWSAMIRPRRGCAIMTFASSSGRS
jgi:hypothetical protein